MSYINIPSPSPVDLLRTHTIPPRGSGGCLTAKSKIKTTLTLTPPSITSFTKKTKHIKSCYQLCFAAMSAFHKFVALLVLSILGYRGLPSPPGSQYLLLYA